MHLELSLSLWKGIGHSWKFFREMSSIHAFIFPANLTVYYSLRPFSHAIAPLSKQIPLALGPENIYKLIQLIHIYLKYLSLLTKQGNLCKLWKVKDICYFNFLKKLLFKLKLSWACHKAQIQIFDCWLKHVEYIIITSIETTLTSLTIWKPQKQSNGDLCCDLKLNKSNSPRAQENFWKIMPFLCNCPFLLCGF